MEIHQNPAGHAFLRWLEGFNDEISQNSDKHQQYLSICPLYKYKQHTARLSKASLLPQPGVAWFRQSQPHQRERSSLSEAEAVGQAKKPWNRRSNVDVDQ